MKKLFTVLKALVCVALVSCCGTAQAQKKAVAFFDVQFQSLSFDDFSQTGFYGIGLSVVSFGKSQDRLHMGFNYHMSANYGLSDFATGILYEGGPSFSYDLKDRMYINVPVNCMYAMLSYDHIDSNSWMMKIAPALYIPVGKRSSLFVGPQWCHSFSTSESTFGLCVGLGFGGVDRSAGKR